MIDTSASAHQLCALLLQQQDEDKSREWNPVGYWSHNVISAEHNYSVSEGESLSVA